MGTAFAALAFAAALLPTSSLGAVGRPADGDLSPRLAELAKPSVRAVPRDEQAERLGVASEGPGSLLRQGGRLLVDVRFERGAAAGADGLRAAGGTVLHVSRRYQAVTVAAKPVDLPALAEVPRVGSITEILEPLALAACFGAATSEGDLQLGAMEARDGFELDGSGVDVGILSDSFDRDAGAPTDAADDVASGDLPGPANPCERNLPVALLDDTFGPTGATDEGRAMAQIVHDLAPGASLRFASAFGGELAFADNIRALAEAGADVIVDDVIYLEEPFFQEGPVGVAVKDVTEDGVTYFSAAGNNNLKDAEGRNIASWEAPEFREIACPPELDALGPFEACMDFNPGGDADPTFEITVSKGVTLTVDLQWAQPWEGVTSDLDAYLLDSEDKLLPAGGEDDNLQTQRPLETFSWENETGTQQKVQLAINRCFGVCNPAASGTAKPRLKIALLQNGGGVTATEYPEDAGEDKVGPTIFGHNGAEDAVSVGAVRHNTTSAPEVFSSRGPVTHYFGPVNGIMPAPPLGSPAVLAKPDIVATDGGANTFFGACVSNAWRFFGTSAAAPHAAAVAALQLQAEPGATVAAVKEAQLDTADPVGLFGPTAVGAGLVDAPDAISSLLAEPFPGGEQFPAPVPQSCGLTPGPGEPDDPSPEPPLVTPPDEIADRVAPRTFFRKRPGKVVRTGGAKARVLFRFGSSEDRSTFLCKVDSGLLRPCRARFVRRFEVGSHVLRVMARDRAGNVDRTPAVFRFAVKQRAR